MEELLKGYRRFRADVWPEERARYEALAEGQSPQTLVIACSDSRVDPATVFGAAPGELFIVRNVAALVPPYTPDKDHHGTSAALEFAVRVLKVKQIVVLGHVACGGVRVLVEGAPAEAKDFVEPWMQIAKDAKPFGEGSIFDRYEAAVVRQSMQNLLTFPWIAEAVETGRLSIHGLRFGIHNGVLSRLLGDRFVPVN